MARLTDYTSYADAQAQFSPAKLWELFDGDRERLNIAHECIDRHADGDRSGRDRRPCRRARARSLSFREIIAEDSSRFAHWLVAEGVEPGDRVAIMLEPSRAFYAAVFGAMKVGRHRRAAVHAVRARRRAAAGRRLQAAACWSPTPRRRRCCRRPVRASSSPMPPSSPTSRASRRTSTPTRAADELAIFQYTSGTTRELPEAVKHTHRAIVTLMVAALYGTGLRPGDRFICPSSPAWGHGLWHGTLAPLALGHHHRRLCRQVRRRAAAEGAAGPPVHQPLGGRHALPHDAQLGRGAAAIATSLEKLSFTGEPIDSETAAFVEATFGRPACSMYGTTEIGVILVSYPGAADFAVKPGSLGKPIPGGKRRGA